MSRVVAYVRVSTDTQELENQRFEIARFAERRGYIIDVWDEEIISGTVEAKDRRIGAVIDGLESGDTLIVSEISRISRSLTSILVILRDATKRGVTLVTVKESFVFGDNLNSTIIAAGFGMAAEIERSLISNRTKEALARKRAEGVTLGRPVGSSRPEKLKLYGQDDRILDLLEKGVAKTAISRILDVNRATLDRYIHRQDLMVKLRWRRFEKMGN